MRRGATSFVKSEPELCRVRCVLGLRAIKSLESGPDRRSSRFLGIVDIKFAWVLGEMQFVVVVSFDVFWWQFVIVSTRSF